jgi:hypothetical protein
MNKIVTMVAAGVGSEDDEKANVTYARGGANTISFFRGRKSERT